MENGRGPEYDNEIEIDLKDLFLELLSFWKLILLAFVVGCILGSVMTTGLSSLIVLRKEDVVGYQIIV